MRVDAPKSWLRVIGEELDQPYFHELAAFVDAERQRFAVYPPEADVFSALKLTPYAQARVVLLGQDPYHEPGQAHGLCFSVLPGVALPPSLRNIFRELRDDLGCPIPNNGYLISWATQGVLLLNTVLTVRAHAPNSHRGKGWERFTDAIIRSVNEKNHRVVFVLWGAAAQRKVELITSARHVIVRAAHPSPLSARNGFFGSKPFSAINTALAAVGEPEITWQIPDR
ncbi:MAG TPA: uracil-DNA glycosylase [Ktedonobacterales bacterium]|jgi:uracil-DNA glycosylase|nr:uracil-DNA glycosylase [Ktedonobacterales bacterium]